MPSSIRVLLVTTSESDRRLIRRLLRGRPVRFRVSHVSSLDDLRARLTNGHFDAAIVDLDGWQQQFIALDCARSLAPELPIVALSGTDNTSDAIQRGADSFVVKTDHGLDRLPDVITATLRHTADSARPHPQLMPVESSDNRYHLLFNHVQDALFVCDGSGKILQANISAERLLDRAVTTLIGTPLIRWLDLAGDPDASLASLAARESIRRLLRRRAIMVELSVSPFTLEDRAAYLVTMRDLGHEDRMAGFMRALAAAAVAMQGALTPTDVFRAAGEQLRSMGLLLSVFRFLEDENALVLSHTELAPRFLKYARRVTRLDPLAFRIRVDSSPTLQSILNSDAPQILPDSTQVIREMLPPGLKRMAAPLHKAVGYEEQFGLRVNLDRHVYGIMLVGYAHGQPMPEDQPVIQAFGSQVEAALERARHFELAQSKLLAKLQELTQLAQVGEQIRLRAPLDSLLDTISRAIRESLGWERVILWLRDEQTRQLRPAGIQGVPVPDGAGSLDLNQVEWRNDNYRLGRSYFVPQGDKVVGAWQAGDLLVVPLKAGDQLLGAIQVDQPSSGQRPSPEAVVSLALFANQAAVAIENAQILERASRRLTQRTDELTALAALSAINDRGDLHAALTFALNKVLEMSGMEAGIVSLLDPPTGELRMHVRQGLSDLLWDVARRHPMHIGEGVAGRALATGRVSAISDVYNDPRMWYREEAIHEGIRMVVGIGLTGRNPVGAITLFARSVRQFSDETLDWLTVAGRQVALSIENTRLLENTHRRQQMADAIREVNAAVASNLELEEVLSTILDRIGRVVPCDTSSVLRLEPNALRIIASHGLADPGGALGYAFPLDERDPAWQAILSRQVQVIGDVQLVEGWSAGPFAVRGIRAWIGAPLIVHDQVIGLLTLDHHEPGFYTEEDARNVALIAQQAAVAIDNAERFKTERGRSERLALVNDIGRELAMALDRGTILQLAVERTAQRLGYTGVEVHLLDAVTKKLSLAVRSGSGSSDAFIASGQHVVTGNISHVVETGQTYVSSAASVDPYDIHPERSTTRSEIAVPLHAEDRTIGVLHVTSERLNAFGPDDVAMLETLATQIGAALSIADLYQETQARAGKLSILFAASQEFGSSLDSDQVFGRLAQWIVSAVDATSAHVYVWDLPASLGRLMAQYVGGRASLIERQSMVGSEQTLSDLPELVQSIQSREPVAYLKDAANERIDAALLTTLRARQVASALYLPLIVRERLIGCVDVWDTDRERTWQADEVHLCQTIANVAAGAIDNARLFEMERQRRQVAETVRELAAVVSSSLELEPILGALLDHAAALIPYDSASVLIAENGHWRLAVSRGLPEAYRDHSLHFPADGATGQMIFAQQPVMYADVRDVADWVWLPGLESIRGWLGVPLAVKGQVTGMLAFDSLTIGRYRREHVEIAQTIAHHAAVAIDNARLYQETRQRLRELETLQGVSLEISQTLNLQRVSQAITDGALRLLQATAVHLFSFDAEADVLQRVASTAEPGYEIVGQPTPRRSGLTMQVAHSGRAVVINDPHNDPEFSSVTRLWPGSVEAIVGLPLQIRGRVLGVMNVIFHVPHVIHDNEVRILGLLADQAATALENARLFEVEQGRRVAADVLREMSVVLTSTLDLNEVFERLFDQIARVIPYTSASVLRLENPNCLRLIAGRGFANPDRLLGMTVDMTDDAPSSKVIRTRQPLILENVHDLATGQAPPGMEEVHSWMGAPLIVRGEISGTLAVDHSQAGAYHPEQAELLGVIANQAAAAIANARLYEQALEREQFASALGRVSLAITSTLDLNAVLDQICRESAEAFKVDTSLVWLVEKGEIVLFAGHGPARETILGMRVPLDDPLVLGARVIRQGYGEFVNDAETSGRIRPDLIHRTRLKSLLSVPMYTAGTPIGALVIGDSTRPDRFAPADIERAEVLASHASIAIENARLFQAEQLRARQLALVNRVGLDVASILDLDQLAQTVVEEIRSAFGYYWANLVTLDSTSMVWRAGAGGEASSGSPVRLRIPLGEGIVGAAAVSGEIIWVRDVRLDPRFKDSPWTPGTLAEVALPLKAKGVVIGVLNVESDQVDAFSEEALAVLKSLASQLSVAVENAQLYQALSQYAASLESRVAERTAEIRREQERTIIILNSVADAVLVTDLTGAIVLTNPVADAVLHDDEQGEDGGRLRRWLSELAPDSSSPKIEVGDHTLQAAVAYIREGDRPVGHVIVLRDITRLEEVDRLKTQFVSTVSHELRTPLTNIKLYLGLFEKGKPEKRAQYLATLQSEVGRLERLISDLLDLSRLERGRHTIIHESIDLVAVLRHVVSTLSPQAEAKQQTLRLEVDRPLLRLPADRNQMIQVFVNLTANAINYTPTGGRVTLKASMALRAGREGAVVSVNDTGIGIPPQDFDRIFDRFYRGQAENFEMSGTGLGLAIVKEIVTQHSGQITVESQINQGSTFRIWLPLSQPRSHTERKGTEAPDDF